MAAKLADKRSIRMSDDYVTITCVMKSKTDKAVLIDVGDAVTHPSWIPRSCLHAMSDIAVANARKDDELELRLREWVARREGFL
jgi:hypothetical protein